MSLLTIANNRTPLTLIAALAATWIAGAAQAQFFFAAPATTATVGDTGPTGDEIADLLDGSRPLDEQSWDDCDLDEDLGSYDGYADDDERAAALDELAWRRSGLVEMAGEYDDFTDDVSRLEAAGQAAFTEVLVGIADLMLGWSVIPDGGFDAVDGLEPDDLGCLPGDEENEDDDPWYPDWDGDDGDSEDEDRDDWDGSDGFWGGEGAPFPMLTATADLRALMAEMLR